MNLLLLDAAEVGGDRATVAGRRARHLLDVLRVAPGHRLRAGVIGGAIGEAEVIRVAGDEVEVRVTLGAPPAPPPAIDLIVAVPRPKALSRLLQHAAAFAVRRIDLVNAWRVDKSYLGSSRLDDAAVGEALRLGAEQGVTTRLPEVVRHARLMGFLDDVLPAAVPDGAARLALHPRGARPIEAALPPGDARPVVLAIGPEGGWIDREVDTFAARGFARASLGEPVLRVEAAVTAALAQVTLLRRLGQDPGSSSST